MGQQVAGAETAGGHQTCALPLRTFPVTSSWARGPAALLTQKPVLQALVGLHPEPSLLLPAPPHAGSATSNVPHAASAFSHFPAYSRVTMWFQDHRCFYRLWQVRATSTQESAV